MSLQHYVSRLDIIQDGKHINQMYINYVVEMQLWLALSLGHLLYFSYLSQKGGHFWLALHFLYTLGVFV